MNFFSLGALLVVGAMATPMPALRSVTTPDGLTIHNVGHQGDGVYMAVFDANGTATVEFTPATEHWKDTASSLSRDDDDDGSTSDLAERSLTKRQGITCSTRKGNNANMDAANVQLANNAAATGYYPIHAWGWVFHANEASYFCNYQAQYLTYSLIIDFHTAVSKACGQTNYGFDRCTNDCGARDLAVGRTFYGDHFCTSTFRGY